MTWRRGCLVGCVGLVAICLILFGVARYIFVPRVRDAVARDVQTGVRSAVADYLASPEPAAKAGTYTITAGSLGSQLTSAAKDYGIDKVTVEIHRTGFQLTLHLSNSDLSYTGQAKVQNGQFVATGVKAGNGTASFLLPADKLARAMTDGVNNALAAQGLALTQLRLAEGEMILTTVPAK